MDTVQLDKAYKRLAQLVQVNIKGKIESGPTKAYKTGDLYRSVSHKITPIEGGASIAYSMNYYAEFVNFGTFDIRPRRFIEAGLEESGLRIEQIIADAAEQDVMVELDKQLD